MTIIELKFYQEKVSNLLKDEKNDEDLLETSFGGINVKKYMNSNCYKEFSDGKNGFYTVYRDFFEKIKS